MGENKKMVANVAKATGIILIINLVVKMLGFLRETFIAGAYGASGISDAYLAAYTLPYFLQAILGSALVTAVVPVITKHFVAGNYEEASKVGSSIMNIMAILLSGISLIGIMIAPILVALTAPGFEAEQARLTTELSRIMFPAVVFMGVGMVVTGILNAGYRFAIGAFAPGFSNIIIILTVIFCTAAFGVEGLAYGTLISFAGLLLIQLPFLKKMGFRYSFTMDWRHPDVQQVLKAIMPIVLGVAVNQIYFAINRIFASGLAEGSISALNYASKLMNLPVGIFVAAVASAIYPALATFALEKNRNAMCSSLEKGLGMVFLVSIPAAVGLMVLRVPIVQLLFERGAFDHTATLITAQALFYFSIGLVAVACNMVLTRAFYALNDTRTPVILGFWSIVLNVVCSFLFVGPFSHGGLALANSIAAIGNTALLYLAWLKKNPEWQGKNLYYGVVKITIAAVVMGIAVLGADMVFGRVFAGHGSMQLLLRVCGDIGVGGLCYFLAALLLQVEYVTDALAVVKKKLARK